MAKKITQNVNKDNFLNDLPKVRPEMSKWSNRHTNYQSCNAGDIVPIYYDEVLPGEKRKITLGMISHTTTPIAPIFPAMYTEIRCFFVPHRLSADLLNGYKTRKSPWVKVFGEDNASNDATIIVPLADQKLPDLDNDFLTSVAALMRDHDNAGSMDNIFDSLDVPFGDASVLKEYNFLNLASYELIYQRHYRNENYEAATASKLYRFLFDAYDGVYDDDLDVSFTFEQASREKDYFTGSKPFTQKSAEPVRVGLGDSADILLKTSPSMDEGDNLLSVKLASGDVPASGTKLINLSNPGNQKVYLADPANPVNQEGPSMLYVDLKNAKGISIEELRILIKTQELLEKDAIYGSMYAESLNAHFGTCPLDLTLQDPQELYKTTITSQMQAIFQTSTTEGEASILGTIGANSTTQTDPFVILPETEFKEHGILMICAVHKLQNVYDSRFFIPKFNSKKSRFDFYTPELNDLGFQPITRKEATAMDGDTLSTPVSYNEAFAEYRYKFNKRHGKLNTQFMYWAPAVGEEYSGIASLYKQNPDELDQALSVVSSTASQFYDAWGFEEEVTKPMSLHSIPGMDGVI